MGFPKIENLKLLLYGAETARGTLITYPYYGVAGAYGTSLPARRVRAGEIFTNFGFWEGCHEGVVRVSRGCHEGVVRVPTEKHVLGVWKIVNLKYLLSGARRASGNLITLPYCGVASACGTNARARRERAGELFAIFGFWERERHRDRARESGRVSEREKKKEEKEESE